MTVANRRPLVVGVGGGIAGLAAAYFLHDRGADVPVVEGAERIGGKLSVSRIAGIAVDEGAEALLARRPEGVELIGKIGLAGEQVFPGTTAASIYSRGHFRGLPKRQFMGVPADFDDLAATGILSPEGLDRAREDLLRPATARQGDVAVGQYLGERFGAELVDRLVDPLLGGVYSGRADRLSFEATLPALAQASLRTDSVARAAAGLLGPPPPQPDEPGQPSRPMFTTLAGGLGTLPEALAKASGAPIRTGALVSELRPAAGGWRLRVGPEHAPEFVEADTVVLALPADPAGRLLRGAAEAGAGPAATRAAIALAEIEYASMAIVTLAYPASAFPMPPSGSGYLVPAVDGKAVKAVTFSSVKWPHLAVGGLQIVRCSLGRIGEEAILQLDDAGLAALAAADLAEATGVTGLPVGRRVTRWPAALPQYSVGHLERVRRIRDSVAVLPGLAVCGAAYDGVGIPACVASARLAAEQVLREGTAAHAGQLRYGSRRGEGPAEGPRPEPADQVHDVVGLRGARPGRD